MSVNQVTLMGRIGKDPEIRTVGQNDSKVATFSLCTGGKYKTNDGREIDDTAWHNIVAWRNLADLAEKYIRKGSQILVIGRLFYREYTDNNGNKKYVTDIVAEKIELCGERTNASAPAPAHAQPSQQSVPLYQQADDPSDDLPF